ncbi:hypothetical protein [Tepidicaulis sp.]|uniref:hypothetical protein n=1 Tax=Tepidicaulis sp. TaxID=1920809 RepID=UPI003B5CE871
MDKLDLNRTAALLTVIVMIAIAALSGYRLVIGPSGLTFERAASTSVEAADSIANGRIDGAQ